MIRENLAEETYRAIQRAGYKPSNIKWVRTATGRISVGEFFEQAAKIDYDADYGVVHIDPTLEVVGQFWWLERRNYDGLEGWVFQRRRQEPEVYATDYHLAADAQPDADRWIKELEESHFPRTREEGNIVTIKRRISIDESE